MNVQQANFRDASTEKTGEQFILDRSSFPQRVAGVTAVAASEADDVDRGARFPQKAIDAARTHPLLGVQIPQAFGGDGASIFDITDMCYALGRACSSTAMIFAMHQTKVACLVRHGAGSAYHEALMRRVASEQVLLAITKDDYTLERSGEWETLGMRGTCSAGFELKFKGSSEQIFPEGYD